MDYYAATLREPGTKLNNDGLMVKGVHLKDGKDLVVMVLCSAGTDGKLCDKIIRTAEKLFYKSCDRDVTGQLRMLFGRFGRRGLFIKKAMPLLTVLVITGTNYFVMNRGNSKVVSVSRMGISDFSSEKIWSKRDGYSVTIGELSEGSTIIAANEAFYSRQLFSEIHGRMCPQMCTCEKSMQENIEYLANQLWCRGEERPVSAVALCVK